MNFPFFQIHAGNLVDSIGSLIEMILVFFEELVSKTPTDILQTLVPGTMSMPNIHPLLVHFPIVLLPAFFVLDLIGTLTNNPGWRKVASWLLYLGAVTALLTVVAGFFAAKTVPHGIEVHNIIEKHKMFGVSIAGLTMILSVWRLASRHFPRREANVLHLTLAAMVCIALVLGADLGGLMVYKYGVGVEAAVQPADSKEHQHAADHSSYGRLKNMAHRVSNVIIN
ncbi:MAG: DUF2231 domain-containing protein [Gammaproteobacteria bacterium]